MKTLIMLLLMAIVTIALLLPMTLIVANATLYRLENSHNNADTAFEQRSNYNGGHWNNEDLYRSIYNSEDAEGTQSTSRYARVASW